MDPAPFYPKCKFGTVELLRACPRLVGQVPALAGLKDFIVVYATTSQNADTLNIVFPAHHDSTSNLALADYVTKRLQEAIEEFSASTISAMGTPEMVRATSADASEAQVGIGEFQARIDQIDESTAWMTFEFGDGADYLGEMDIAHLPGDAREAGRRVRGIFLEIDGKMRVEFEAEPVAAVTREEQDALHDELDCLFATATPR